MAPRITIVNDNPEFMELVHDILEEERYVASTVDGDRDDALARIVDSAPELLIIDLRMGSDVLHGWEIAQEVRRTPKLDGLPVIICSADVLAMRELAGQMAKAKRVRTLVKPFSIDELTTAIDGLLADAVPG